MGFVISQEPILIAIDDTDNLESRGTGFRARQLGQRLQDHGLAKLRAITRHQLHVCAEIPYTSHNSSACLDMWADPRRLDDLIAFCAEFLLAESAPGSDAGLCVAPLAVVDEGIIEWGQRAKREVLTQAEARQLAGQGNLFLEGYTGTTGGIIGALAATGLRKSGDDGRYLWLRGIRERVAGRYPLRQLLVETDVEAFRPVDSEAIPSLDDFVEITEWFRPVLIGGQAVLLLEKNDDKSECLWRTAGKQHVKNH